MPIYLHWKSASISKDGGFPAPDANFRQLFQRPRLQFATQTWASLNVAKRCSHAAVSNRRWGLTKVKTSDRLNTTTRLEQSSSYETLRNLEASVFVVWDFQRLKSNTILQTSLFCVPNYSCTWPAWFPPWPFQYLWKSKGLADVNVPKQLVQADAMVTSQEKMCQLLFSRRYCYKWIIEGDAVSLPTWLPWDRKFCLLFGSFGSVVDGSSTMFATTVVSSLIALVDGGALMSLPFAIGKLQSWDFYPFFRLYTAGVTHADLLRISSYGHRLCFSFT